jgi:hypothetical protein
MKKHWRHTERAIRRRVSRPLAFAGLALATALSLAAIASAATSTITVGNLVLKIRSSVSPKTLPKKELAPITFNLGVSVSTKDGTHPPAAVTFQGDVDKNSAINARGLPVCKVGLLEARTTAAAKEACEEALVGQGFAKAEVEFPESAPFDAKGPLLVFNGGQRGGKTLILIHVYANVPTPTAFVTKVNVTKVNNGKYGLKFDSQIPVVAGGAGSLTEFSVKLRRTFTHGGKQQSYLVAKCPLGRLFGQGTLAFTDGTRLKGTAALPCTPTE